MRADVSFEDVVKAPQDIMGVKAVWGEATDALMCVRWERQARTITERAQSQPYVLYIGGGQKVPGSLRGRVLELAEVAPEYEPTAQLARTRELGRQLAPWGYAIKVSSLYSIKGKPSLVRDLKFKDRSILASSYGNVVGEQEDLRRLWEKLKGYSLEKGNGKVEPRPWN